MTTNVHEYDGSGMGSLGRNDDRFQCACHGFFSSLLVSCTGGVTSSDYKDGEKNECGGDGGSG